MIGMRMSLEQALASYLHQQRALVMKVIEFLCHYKFKSNLRLAMWVEPLVNVTKSFIYENTNRAMLGGEVRTYLGKEEPLLIEPSYESPTDPLMEHFHTQTKTLMLMVNEDKLKNSHKRIKMIEMGPFME